MPSCFLWKKVAEQKGVHIMIEIIQEEEFERTKRKELPKEIKQIGRPDIGERIYVENQTYEFLHPYDIGSEKMAYILLGEFENFAGRQCVFVEAAIRLEEVMFDGELPLWNDQTWAYIYRHLKQEYDNLAIIGWAMDIKGQLPNLTLRMESLHQQNFGGTHQVLLLMDSLEREEAFYGSRNGHLYRRDGFYIYYDKTIPTRMNLAMEEIREEEQQKEESTPDRIIEIEKPAGNYRKQLLEHEDGQATRSYAASFLLLVVVCAFGLTAYLNYQKMNAMEETLARMNASQYTSVQSTQNAMTQTTENIEELQGTENPQVKVETVEGNVEKEVTEADTQQVAETELADTQSVVPEAVSQDATQDVTATQVPASVSEAQTYLAQGYYIVQKGDSLIGICKKVYQTAAMMDKLCEVNQIEDENAIYAGQKLILPN